MRATPRSVLGIAAAVEAVTGLLLIVVPHLLAKLLLGAEVTGVAVVARCRGPRRPDGAARLCLVEESQDRRMKFCDCGRKASRGPARRAKVLD